MKKKKIYKPISSKITVNKRVHHAYFISEEIEAGLVLEGWEAKALRAGNANINDSYILLKDGEAYLFGVTINPLKVSSSYLVGDTVRTRKLLLNQRELDSLFGKINRKGYTAIALSIYWKNAWCKVKIGLAKGKREYDRRLEIKEREWNLNKARIMKNTRILNFF